MTKSSYKERARLRREREILTVTRQLMSEKGFMSMSMDDIAEAVGISKPTLYQHFSTKAALIVRVVSLFFEELEADLAHIPEQPAIAQFEQVLRRMIERSFTSSGLQPHMHPEIITLIHDNTDLQAHRTRVIQGLHDLIDRAKHEGSIRPDIPTPMIARMVFVLQRVSIDPTQLDHKREPAELDETATQAVNLLMNGIRS